jgi:hypothetical protein
MRNSDAEVDMVHAARGWWWWVTILALAGSGCADRSCGPGTQPAQDSDGKPICAPVALGAGSVQCDPATGVMLVDGDRCLPVIQCGPGTQLDSGSHQCVPAAMGAHDPPVCVTPAAGHVCVNGTLRHLVDGSYLTGETVTVSLYDLTAFFGNPSPPPLAEVQATDTFMVPSIATPMYLGVVTRDPAGGSTYQATAIATSGSDGVIRLDGYVLTRAQYDAWALPADYLTQGPLFFRFFDDPAPPIDARTPTETHPVAGVKLQLGGANDSRARYFGASLAAVDGTATSSGASGGVITSASGLPPLSFGASGGSVSAWETRQSLPVPNIVVVDFFHPQ